MNERGGITGGDIITLGIGTVIQILMPVGRIMIAREIHVGLLKMARERVSERGNTGTEIGTGDSRRDVEYASGTLQQRRFEKNLRHSLQL